MTRHDCAEECCADYGEPPEVDPPECVCSEPARGKDDRCDTCGNWIYAEPEDTTMPRAQNAPPPCLASMGCLCAGHARGNSATAACDTSERFRPPPTAPVIRTRYLQPTGRRGARVVAKCVYSARSLIRPWDHSLDTTENHANAAAALSHRIGLPAIESACWELGDSYLFVCGVVRK